MIQPTDPKPAHPIKMIALDLDGTTLRTDKTVGPRTAEALRAAHKKGVEITLASGRMTPAMEDTAEALGIDCNIVSYNGAAVCGRAAAGRKRLYHQPLPAAIARELFDWARERRYQVNFYHEDVIVSEDAPHLMPYVNLYRSRTKSPYRLVKNLEEFMHISPTKLLIVVDPPVRNKIDAELRPLFSSRSTVIRTDPEFLEFLDPSVDKGRGVAKLAEILGMTMDNVLACGDGENDVTMIATAGFGVAVGNAIPEVKAVAKAVTRADHNNDAVAEAVERWVL
jgi:Cof subfamily protein (haloacid dehalogenase superfamily)